MEMDLSQRTINEIARRVAVIIARKLREAQEEPQPEIVDTKEAAAILKVTPGRMRQIASRYPHVKQGDHKQGRLLFLRKALLMPESYHSQDFMIAANGEAPPRKAPNR